MKKVAKVLMLLAVMVLGVHVAGGQAYGQTVVGGNSITWTDSTNLGLNANSIIWTDGVNTGIHVNSITWTDGTES